MRFTQESCQGGQGDLCKTSDTLLRKTALLQNPKLSIPTFEYRCIEAWNRLRALHH